MAPSAVYAQAQATRSAGKGKRKLDAAEVEDIEAEEEEESTTLLSDEEASEEEQDDDDEVEEAAVTGMSSRSTALSTSASTSASKSKTYKQKTLILSSRGITHRMRHMMKDLAALLPHSKTDAKLDTKHQLGLLNELADLSNCSSALFFEARRHADLYLWTSMTPNGPSVRFQLLNSHTMDELKMTGNCLKGSRPIVVFDKTFDETAHWRLIKECLTQTFAAPKTARRAKPFIDHVTSFSVTDGKIWFRNYQIIHDAPLDLNTSTEAEIAAEKANSSKKGTKKQKLSRQPDENMSMNEIGPRFVLVPVKIFEGSFGGAVVWENPSYTAPQAKLAASKYAKAVEYRGRKDAEETRKTRKEFLDTQEQEERVNSGRAALDRTKVFA